MSTTRNKRDYVEAQAPIFFHAIIRTSTRKNDQYFIYFILYSFNLFILI